jgi:hypothetical protein
MYHEGSSVASDDATGVLQLRERGREVRHCSTQRGGGGGGGGAPAKIYRGQVAPVLRVIQMVVRENEGVDVS